MCIRYKKRVFFSVAKKSYSIFYYSSYKIGLYFDRILCNVQTKFLKYKKTFFSYFITINTFHFIRLLFLLFNFNLFCFKMSISVRKLVEILSLTKKWNITSSAGQNFLCQSNIKHFDKINF